MKKPNKNVKVEGIKTTGNLLCRSGRINPYRFSFLHGVGASRKESTFDPSLGKHGGHKCCGSKVTWRHKTDCKNAVKNAPDDYSDLKDI